MTLVVVSPGGFAPIARTLRHLAAQSESSRLELVLVTLPFDETADRPPEVASFARSVTVVVAPAASVGEARAAGVMAATAPVVAFTEEHAYPQAGWARALIAAHQGPWIGVGPAVENANPETITSRADFLIAYGRWAGPTAAGPVDDLPGHNSSYKREALVSYGSRLADLLSAETNLHWDLRSRGGLLYLEPAARTVHVSVAHFGDWLLKRILTGRLFGHKRAVGWPRRRRAAYAAGAPLIPLIRLGRILSLARERRPAVDRRPAVLALVFVGLVLEAAGEAVGYVVGAGDVEARLVRFELHRGTW